MAEQLFQPPPFQQFQIPGWQQISPGTISPFQPSPGAQLPPGQPYQPQDIGLPDIPQFPLNWQYQSGFPVPPLPQPQAPSPAFGTSLFPSLPTPSWNPSLPQFGDVAGGIAEQLGLVNTRLGNLANRLGRGWRIRPGQRVGDEYARSLIDNLGQTIEQPDIARIGRENVRDVSSEVFTPEMVQLIASRAAAPTIRAYRDAEREFASLAAREGYANPERLAALRARGKIESAGALQAAHRDAAIQAAIANAQQALAARGQDIALRQQDIAQRLADMEQAFRYAGLNAQQARAAAEAALTLRGQDVAQRAQDIQAKIASGQLSLRAGQLALQALAQQAGNMIAGGQLGLTQRGQDISSALGLERLRGEKYGIDQRVLMQNAALQQQLLALDQQLANASLDRATRQWLEMLRGNIQQALQRNQLELEAARLRQQESQFARRLGLDLERTRQAERQFGAQFGEGQRQFDARLAEMARQFDIGRRTGTFEVPGAEVTGFLPFSPPRQLPATTTGGASGSQPPAIDWQQLVSLAQQIASDPNLPPEWRQLFETLAGG